MCILYEIRFWIECFLCLSENICFNEGIQILIVILGEFEDFLIILVVDLQFLQLLSVKSLELLFGVRESQDRLEMELIF